MKIKHSVPSGVPCRVNMKSILSLTCLFFFFGEAKAQKDIRRIDSLVSIIENSKNVNVIGGCDTVSVSHINFWVRYCKTYYYFNEELIKVISESGRTPIPKRDSLFEYIDLSSIHIFYFEKDTLIKTIEKWLSPSINIIDKYYFTEYDLSSWGQGTEIYKRVKNQLDLANELLNNSKKMKQK